MEILFELDQLPVVDCVPHFPHKRHKIMDIVGRIQAIGKELLCHEKMTKVGP
jgi:hypothetical protein